MKGPAAAAYVITAGGKQPFLAGRTAFVSGASAGIGIAIAEALLRNGARVAGTYHEHGGALEALERAYGKQRVLPLRANFMDPKFGEEVARSYRKAEQWGGKPVSILVNVTGKWMISPFLYEEPAQRAELWRLNYEVAVAYMEEAVKGMIANRAGDIVNISSTGGVRGAGQQGTYCATKAALSNLTRSLAEELGPRNVKVNAISPGPTMTKALDAYLDDVGKELLLKNIPRSRFCAPEDIANAVLSALMNDYMTGAEIILHGGKL